jgi:hypothetical protein
VILFMATLNQLPELMKQSKKKNDKARPKQSSTSTPIEAAAKDQDVNTKPSARAAVATVATAAPGWMTDTSHRQTRSMASSNYATGSTNPNDSDVQSKANVSMAGTSSPSGSLASTQSTHKRKTSKNESTEPPIKKTRRPTTASTQKVAAFGAPQDTDKKLTASTATVPAAAGTAVLAHSQAIAAMSTMSTEETSAAHATAATDEAPSEGYEAQSPVNMDLKARFLTKSDPQTGDAAVTNAVPLSILLLQQPPLGPKIGQF